MLNKRGAFLARLLAAFFVFIIAFGCANRQLPQGGPRDHDPPKLLKATPPNMTRNFAAKEIVLQFDEYFKLVSPYSEIVMSPAPGKLPEYKVRKKNLVIDMKDTLEKNTTYVINFGKAIADVNESNVLKNFTYVFSNGAHIDSLSITGSVINTLTQQKEKDVVVFLFTLKQDSLLFGKKKPTIFTNTDTAGNFTLNNLHADDYRIYALKDPSAPANRVYNNDKELIAFNKKMIHLTTDTSNLQLKLFRATPSKFRLVDKRTDIDGKMFFSFNKRLDNPSLHILYPPGFDDQKVVDFTKTKDTAQLYMKNMDFDSIRVAFYDNNKPLDTVSLKKGRKESFTRTLTFTYNIDNNNKLKPGTPLNIKAMYPIQSADINQISLKEDSADVTNFTITHDSVTQKNFFLNYRWKENDNYTITLNEAAFTDIYGDKNKRSFKRFNINKQENYSQLTLKITVPDTGRSYVVELLNEQRTLLQSDVIRKSASLVYKNYLTGKYRVRVVYDDNNNGKWDSGNVTQRLQPENVWADEDIISLRPNWEQETPIVIPKEPVNP